MDSLESGVTLDGFSSKRMKLCEENTRRSPNPNDDHNSSKREGTPEQMSVDNHDGEKTEVNENITQETQQISKRQLKRLKKLKEFEKKRIKKRIEERLRHKLKREEAASKGLPTRTGPSRKELKLNKMENTKNYLKIAIDLDFDDLMIPRDICKCTKQLLRIYTINRRSQSPCKLFFVGINKQGNIHTALEKHDGYQNWDVQWHFKPYTEIFEKDKIVYLTSDSENVINKLDEDCVYIIGGIVDHNHHKGICYERAQKLGLKTARLPLSTYVDLKTRSVLSTVHVFDILLQVSHGKEWTKAILDVLPARKGAKLRE